MRPPPSHHGQVVCLVRVTSTSWSYAAKSPTQKPPSLPSFLPFFHFHFPPPGPPLPPPRRTRRGNYGGGVRRRSVVEWCDRPPLVAQWWWEGPRGGHSRRHRYWFHSPLPLNVSIGHPPTCPDSEGIISISSYGSRESNSLEPKRLHCERRSTMLEGLLPPRRCPQRCPRTSVSDALRY